MLRRCPKAFETSFGDDRLAGIHENAGLFESARDTFIGVVNVRSQHLWRRDLAAMTIRPTHLNAYEFVVLSALRAQQLMAGCTARLPGTHSAATMAQMEVAEGCVARVKGDAAAGARQCGWQL